MSDFRLPGHVHYCEIDGERVFLDLERDLYFTLPPGAAAALDALAGASAASPSHAALEALAETGILVRAPLGRPVAPARHPKPDRSLVEQSRPRAGWSLLTLIQATFLIARMRRAVARKRLPALLGRLGAMRPASGRAARDALALRFLAARRLVPFPPNCLSDSLALCLFLRRRGMACDLVIGAKLHPFGAHCWLQDGTSILNDTLGAARDFHPVLIA
ncbi:MAG TPA: lasso peptide biosynthesis B2 protein [Allosphingosinicella sp.]|nr:lasso peptide biosynthesis B2 protein [Allosphingosinicella sp.]